MESVIRPALITLVARANDTATNGTSSTGSTTDTRPAIYRVVGIILAISSGLFIGTSYVVKKTGLLKANVKYHEEAGDGYGYLKNAWWWLGMSIMIVGEICNFVAYAFVDAILVTPMGSLSVVVCTILSAIFLKERLSFVGKVGCFNCIIGSIVIVLNSPSDSSVANIQEMQHYVIAPGFLTYAGVIIVGCVFIAFWAGPRYGKKSMLVYLSVCSLIGGLSVVATQGLGAAIVAQAGGTPQFNQWFLYVLLVFVIVTLVTEIIFLNKALNIFNAALVTPTYYVFFTSATIVTSAILFQGFKGTALQIVTIVMGFLQICAGVILLQLSKSSKDVPDAAVFSGDLDQIRTVAEQAEPESEPKADAIRGAAGILRSLSKSRLRSDAEEVKRIHEERLEPIGEDEQVEWDGLRRRKTILREGQVPLSRRKTVHPPLGLSRFPPNTGDDDHSDAGTHNPENDHGLAFPDFRRMTTMLHRKARTSASDASQGEGIGPHDRAEAQVVQLAPIRAVPPSHQPPQHDGAYDISSQPFPTHQYKAGSGVSDLQAQDTEYKRPAVITIDSDLTKSGDAERGERPLAHLNKRTFSFQHILAGSRRVASGSTMGSDEARPPSATSNASLPGRVFSGLRRGTGGRTEEERLGLVHGDAEYDPLHARVGVCGDDGLRTSDGPDGLDEEEERASFDDGADLESGGYSRVRRRDDDDDDDEPYGGAASGAAFV